MSLFKSIFGKKELPPLDISKIKVDMHSHLIPGIDDGSQSMEDTLDMLKAFQDLGYTHIITTPHIKLGSFENTTEIIRSGESEVLKAIDAREDLNIKFQAAAEYFFDFSFMDRIEKNDLLSFCDNHVLVEYAFGQPPMGEKDMFFALQMKGYKPILAHFERYGYFHGSVKVAQELRDKGIKIQANLCSFVGHYGPEVQKQAELMLKENCIDLVSSDGHRMEHLAIIASNLDHKNMSALNNLTLYNSKLASF